MGSQLEFLNENRPGDNHINENIYQLNVSIFNP